MKINNAAFKAARVKFTEQQGIGVNASRKILADSAGLKSVQRIIDYETSPGCGANLLVVKALAEAMDVKVEDIAGGD